MKSHVVLKLRGSLLLNYYCTYPHAIYHISHAAKDIQERRYSGTDRKTIEEGIATLNIL